MFRVLLAKLVEKDISLEKLSDLISKNVKMSPKVLKQCINGEREFRLIECVAIRNAVAPEMTIDELFKPKTDKAN